MPHLDRVLYIHVALSSPHQQVENENNLKLCCINTEIAENKNLLGITRHKIEPIVWR